MTEWSVVPAIRVPDMSAGIEFYVDRLRFRVERGGPNEGNVSLSFGQARVMLDSVPTEYYSPAYNEAINGRIGSASALALYIEAPNLDAYYARVGEQGVRWSIPSPTDHGVSASSPSRIRRATGSASGRLYQRMTRSWPSPSADRCSRRCRRRHTGHGGRARSQLRAVDR